MLTITVKMSDTEYFDERTERFVKSNDVFVLDLEHSLASLSKWESRFEKPFLGHGDKTVEETIWYIEAMTLTQNVPPEVYGRLSKENVEAVSNYIDAKMTATTFSAQPSKRQTEIITAEIILHWMISLNIPLECQNWHLNRLMALIRTISEKNAPKKKMNPKELAARNRQLNEERLKKFNTTG